VIRESKIRPVGAESGYFEAARGRQRDNVHGTSSLALFPPDGNIAWIIDREPSNIKAETIWRAWTARLWGQSTARAGQEFRENDNVHNI